MKKCETCLNSRPVISENGKHYICTLSITDSMDCIMEIESHYIECPGAKEEITRQTKSGKKVNV